MTETTPPWIAFARSKIGEWTDGPDVPRIAREVGELFPEFAEYAREAGNETPWCGIFVARCLAEAGIRPVSTTAERIGFMWAQRWRNFGRVVDTPQVGDVLVFPSHVTFYVSEDADHYHCLGGNQSDAVTITSYRKSNCEAILRPPAVDDVAEVRAAPIEMTEDEFHAYLPELLEHEGGNDDDPEDPGGRTSRGITQREYDAWRHSHPGLPTDVFDAPDATVEAIFHQKYWDVVQGDPLPPGIDYAVFDYAVNSGPVTAVGALQRALGDVDVDGEVGPLTLASAERADAAAVINAVCDARLVSYKTFKTWPRFGKGWTNRIRDVRRTALAHAAEARPATPPPPVIAPEPPQENHPMTTPAPAPVHPAPDLAAVIDNLSKLASVLAPIAQKMAADPAVRTGAAAVLKVLVPSLGALFPQLGVFGIAAGYILPLLLPDLLGPTGGAVTMATSASVVGASVFGLIKRLVDRFTAVHAS